MIRCSTKSKEFKRLLEQRESYRLANLKLIEEQETRRHKELIKEEKQREVFESLKVDWRKEMYPEVPPQEPVKIVEERKIEIPERLKSNWRNELNEAMTSSGTLLSTLPATGDTNLETINSGTSASYNLTYTLGVNFGSDGFNLGQDYLQFSGDPSQFNSRQAYTISIDTSTFTDISFSVIAGNGSNGGVTPNFNMEVYWYDANGNYGLIGVVPKTTSSLTTYTFTLPDGARGKTIDILIAEGNPPEQSTQYIGQSIPSLHPSVWDSTIAGYINALLSIQNPTSAQLNSSGELIWRAMQQQVYGADGLFLWNPPGYPAPVSGFQLGTTEADRIAVAQAVYNAYGYRGDKYPLTYGVGNLNFQRRTPVNVFVPLDNPEAASFIRVGSDLKTGTPGDRYRKVIQQLKAGQNYTTTKFGSNFPGSNFTGIRDFTPSPIGKDAGYATWGKAAERNANQASSTFAQSQQSISSPPTYQYGNEADFQRWVQSQQTPVGTQVQLPGGGTLTRVPDGSSGFTPTMTYTYDKVTAAGVQKITATIPRGTSSYQQSTIPPKTQSQQKLTPQQLADIDKQIKDLQAQSEKNKRDAENNMNKARLAALVGGAAGGAALGLLGGAAVTAGLGGAAIRAGSQIAKTGPAAARGFAKANPGKYNPFLSQQANKYFGLPKK